MTGDTKGEIHLSVCGRTDRGRVRAENQDSLLVADLGRLATARPSAAAGDAEPASASGSADDGESTAPEFPALQGPESELTLGPKGALLLVADGMGGAAGGGAASRMAVAAVIDQLASDWGARGEPGTPEDFVGELGRALETANTRIHEESFRDARYQGMGTTATLAGVLGSHVYIAQVGDSRAYLVRKGSAVQLTRDQSIVQEFIDAGMMTEEEARENVHRNTILQALGAGETVRADVTFQELRRGDILLLCSDGLSRVVEPEEIAEAAGPAARAAEGERRAAVAELCRSLVELANARGGPDNVTVVAARLDGEGLSLPAPEGDVPARRSFPPA